MKTAFEVKGQYTRDISGWMLRASVSMGSKNIWESAVGNEDMYNDSFITWILFSHYSVVKKFNPSLLFL